MNAVSQGNEYDDEIELVLAYHKGDVRAAIECERDEHPTFSFVNDAAR